MPSVHCEDAHDALLLLYDILLLTGMFHGSRWGYKTQIHMLPLNEMVAMDIESTKLCKHGVAKYIRAQENGYAVFEMLLGCEQNCEQNPVYTAETRRLHSFLEAPTHESVYNAEHVRGKEKYAFQLKGLHSAARANVCMHAVRTCFTSAQSQALD